MSYSIQGGRENPTLAYDVTDAASGAPMRVTMAGGVVALTYNHGMVRVVAGADNQRQQMGFYVPALPALPVAFDPLIVAEISLAQVGVYDGKSNATSMHGVADVHGQVVADPQRGGQRAVYLAFTALGADPMVLRYRITLYHPR